MSDNPLKDKSTPELFEYLTRQSRRNNKHRAAVEEIERRLDEALQSADNAHQEAIAFSYHLNLARAWLSPEIPETIKKRIKDVADHRIHSLAAFQEINRKVEAYDKLIEAAGEDSLASDGLGMIYAGMRRMKEESEDNEF